MEIDNQKELTNRLNKYRDEYYNSNSPSISDSEYDSLFDQLKQMEKDSGIVLSNSPTATVGYEAKSKLVKVKHDIPLLSLDKTKSVPDLVKFIKENPCLMMFKYDGLTVELIYKEGSLIQASTRGDGYVGEDITHNAKTFKNIPLTIPYQGFLRVVGEAIIHRHDFEKINNNLPVGEKPYANARNLVSGSVRQLDNKVCSERNVYFMLWDVMEGLDDVAENPDSRRSKFAACADLGFEKPVTYITDESGLSAIPDGISSLRRKAKDKGIPIDGLVIKYDSISYSRQLGGTSHHNNDGIAFKFEDEIAETKLQDIEWSMGRTGQLTPVAIFDPVELEGTTVSRASLHNVSIMQEILGKYPVICEKIYVRKSNMIIPEVVSAEKQVPPNKDIPNVYRLFTIPTKCPICGHKTEIKIINNTKTLYCINPHCCGKKLVAFEHFVSKSAMNIEGLSEATLNRFIECGWLDTFADIYKLNQHKDDIVKMDGFGVASYNKLWNAIEKSRVTTFDKFLVALGIPNIGKTAAKAISQYCKGDAARFEYLLNQDFYWNILADFGDVMSNSIKQWFQDTANTKVYVDLLNIIQIQKESKSSKNSVFTNKSVVVTGTLKNFTRDSIVSELEKLGAKVSGSVSKKTDYLIAGEKAGSKLAKAQQCGVTILSEDDFLKMIS